MIGYRFNLSHACRFYSSELLQLFKLNFFTIRFFLKFERENESNRRLFVKYLIYNKVANHCFVNVLLSYFYGGNYKYTY